MSYERKTGARRARAGLALLLSGAGAVSAQSTPPPADSALDEVVVTGNRGQPRTVADSQAPIDVIRGEQLETLGANTALRDALAALLPSFQVTTVPSSSQDSVMRPAGLRGLTGAHVLVLVNGKRRHGSAEINNAYGQPGSNPADLDLIPVSAIARIEVLRDGAAAQYGSDAIAGVINIILKSTDHGTSLSTRGGARYKFEDRTDGQSYQLAGNTGLSLPNSGFLNLALDGKYENATERAGPASGTFYFPLANGDPDPREATIDKYIYKGGLPFVRALNLSYDASMALANDISLYSFSTFSARKAQVGQSLRRPNSTNVILEIYPDGTIPSMTLEQRDYQIVAGGKGDFAGWAGDASTSWARDYVDNGSINTLNASLGPSSPTSFRTGTVIFEQWTNNLDVTRSFGFGPGGPTQISWGLEYRHEKYENLAGDPLSYADGGYVYPSGPLAGQRAALGAQGANTITATDQGGASRSISAVYVDVGTQLTSRWEASVAGRAEYYDDGSGSPVSGKLSTRFELTPALSLRGTIGSGFRAPSLAQLSYSQTSTTYTSSTNSFINQRFVLPNSAVGQALGADTLEPEKSRNFSAGLSYQPAPFLTLTLDAYQIDLDNRIALTSFLSGAAVNAILVANGLPSGYAVRYFTNAIDTRTRGVDLVTDIRHDAGGFGTLRWNLGFNWNRTSIERIKPNPPQLSANNLVFFDRASQGQITDWNPNTKLIAGVTWSFGSLETTLKGTRYGRTDNLVNPGSAGTDTHTDSAWITDIDIAYTFDKRYTFGLGANNVFNVYPPETTYAIPNGFPRWPTSTPFGNWGGFYYARFQVNL